MSDTHQTGATAAAPKSARDYTGRLPVLPATIDRLKRLSHRTGIRSYRLADDLLNAAITDMERRLLDAPNN